ncbi:MAG TPA: phosphoribosyltransferase family protein [Nocardioidaceae bacterium]|nr:phosphoribosyltransferase family protein [Nocardioidaceae bacterium]
MRVRDCLGQTFEADCLELARQVSVFDPDVVVGVRRGGAEVSRSIQESGLVPARYVEVGAARPATRVKERSRLSTLLQRLPVHLRNLLRILEHRVRVWRFSRKHRSPGRSVLLPPEATSAVREARRILIVDDAVDSGQTLLAVTEAIGAETSAQVRTAALTVTFPRPLLEPDFFLHRGVLLRFPWSADAGSLV